MKHNIERRTFVILFVATLYVSMAATAQAQGPACSLARAAGTYGFSDSGTVVGVGPRAAAGIVTFDAAGNVTGKVTASLNGAVSHTVLSGTYTVNSDCTGAASFDEFDQSGDLMLTATVDAVWDDNMRELRFVFTSVVLANGTSLPIAVNGDAKKMIP